MVSKELDPDISPASIPCRQPFSWNESIKATNTMIEDDGQTVVFLDGGGFRYCRSEQEFDSGSSRCEIEFDFDGADSQVSFGIANASPLSCDAGVYYFTSAYIYCNYYPSFTRDYSTLHTITPKKLQYKGRIAINFDIDSGTLNWELNDEICETLPLQKGDGKPFYIVIGMFKGKATIL